MQTHYPSHRHNTPTQNSRGKQSREKPGLCARAFPFKTHTRHACTRNTLPRHSGQEERHILSESIEHFAIRVELSLQRCWGTVELPAAALQGGAGGTWTGTEGSTFTQRKWENVSGDKLTLEKSYAALSSLMHGHQSC